MVAEEVGGNGSHEYFVGTCTGPLQNCTCTCLVPEKREGQYKRAICGRGHAHDRSIGKNIGISGLISGGAREGVCKRLAGGFNLLFKTERGGSGNSFCNRRNEPEPTLFKQLSCISSQNQEFPYRLFP